MHELSVANKNTNVTCLPKYVEKHQITFLQSCDIDTRRGTALVRRRPGYAYAKLAVAIEHQAAAIEAFRIGTTPSIRCANHPERNGRHAGTGGFDDLLLVVDSSGFGRRVTAILYRDDRTRSTTTKQRE